MTSPTRSGPIDDLRVLDLTQYIAGPFCTKLFADYGADVVKVEPPGGDPARRFGPFRDDAPDEDAGGLFAYLNANKRGIILDLTTPRGREAAIELARESDVLVESFRPGTLARFGLSYEQLAAVNPRLVVCSISNFGQTGPYRDYAATELVLQAMSGLTFGSGEPEREPLWTPLYLAQQTAGVMAYINCLASVSYVRAVGEGVALDISIQESLMEVQELMMAAYFYSGSIRRRLGHRRETNHPANILPCKDGYVPMLVVLPRDWRALAELIGRPEMADDPRFITGPARARHADEIDTVLVPWLAQHTGEEVYRLAQQQRIPISRVLDAGGILRSPHLRERGFFRTVDSMLMPGPPFAATPAPPAARPAPRLGEHNHEVIGSLMAVVD
jgi:CoA:oxalate CoA-transferase